MTHGERLVLPTAITSLLILAWLEWPWPIALILTLATILIADRQHRHRMEDDWRQRWEVRQQLYLAGDRHARPRR